MYQGFKKIQWLVLLTLIAVYVLSACGGAGASGSNNVQITLDDFKITSSMTTFTKGVSYHFTVTNKGATSHEFWILPVLAAGTSADQVQKAALAGLGQNDLTPGATKSFDYTFTDAAPAGKLELACHLPGHYEAGMHLPIVVN